MVTYVVVAKTKLLKEKQSKRAGVTPVLLTLCHYLQQLNTLSHAYLGHKNNACCKCVRGED